MKSTRPWPAPLRPSPPPTWHHGPRRWRPGSTRTWLGARRSAGMVLLLLMCAGADPALALDGGSAAHGPQPAGDALELDTDIHVEVSGVVARTQVRQRFRNHAGQWVEGQYSYPLPADCAVDELEVRAGSRVIVGEIREREAAREGYRQARESGVRAALVEQDRPNLFETRIANIGPGEDVEVRIGYQLILQLEGGVQELRLPLAVIPRFSPMEVPDEQHPAKAEGAPGHARLSLTIHYPGPLLELESPGHDVQVLDLGERKELTVSLAADAARKDFILRWRYAPQQPEPLLFTETLGGQQFGLLVFYPPEVASTVAIPRDLVLVIDTSGSMEGASMEQAKAALGLAIASLSERDRFNVIQFNDRTEALFQRSMPATAWYRGQAENYIRYLAASGGTMMAPALEAALDGKPEQGVLRQVVFVTDGAIANEEELFEIIARKLGDTRLFTVGIGPAPNGYFMHRAARLGRGSSVRVPEMSALRRGMQALFRKLERPAVMDIAIRAQDGTDLLQGHGPLADLYVGEPVLATFRLPRDAGLITVTGVSDGASWIRQIKPAPRSHPGIARLWGRHRIGELQMELPRGADRAQARAAMTAVALEVGLVSAYTSLVAIDSFRARGGSEALNTLGVPMPLAAGSVAQAGYPQTGLGLMGQWLAALLGLGGAGVMWRIRP